MVKIWHYPNHKGHFYLCVQRKTNALLDVYGRLWKFQVVSQSCNMLHLDVDSSLQICFDHRLVLRFYINVIEFH